VKRWLHGVARMEYGKDASPEVFAGAMKDVDAAISKERGKFNVPAAVACDARGRVYVADYMNDRIQVFSPQKKLLKIIPAVKPARLSVHHKTGELFVCSFLMKSWTMRKTPVPVEACLRRYGPYENPRELARIRLPLLGHRKDRNTWDRVGGSQYIAAVDSWTDPPTLWLVPGSSPHWHRAGIKLYAIEGKTLTLKKDFGAETRKSTMRDVPPGHWRQRLVVDPNTDALYVMEAMVNTDQVVKIDPATGRDKLEELPFSAEDLCFDVNGLAYLRTGSVVARYDPGTWREVPWDYGEERKGVAHAGGRAANLVSALVLPGKRASPWYHGGGFGVSAKGHLVVQVWNGAQFAPTRDRKKKLAGEAGKLYTPRLYPGRQRWGEIHVWDRHGKLVHEDAVPGITITDGVCIDNDDNIYVLANATRMPGGGKLLNPKTETLIKFRPGKGRVITSGKGVPVPLGAGHRPEGPTQMYSHYMSPAWVKGAEWFYGDVGFAGGRCTCWNARFALDYFARSFAPEAGHFSVAVLDTNGNLILRVGRYGNVDDGKPLKANPLAGIAKPRSIGGDEVALMHACYVATRTDRRLYIADAGNACIRSVRLGYHAEARVHLKDVEDQAKGR
jgi:hypothetical protein